MPKTDLLHDGGDFFPEVRAASLRLRVAHGHRVGGGVADAVEVIITTSKVDKYDRYLADVSIRRADGEGVFLSNALLENGHAVPMGAEKMTDWTP